MLCLVAQVVSNSLRPHELYVTCKAPLSMGILQAKILEWVAIPSSRGFSQPRDQAQVSRLVGGFFAIWTTREARRQEGKAFYPKPCMSFQPSGQAAPFNEEQLSQQQPTLLASGGAWVLTGDLSGAQQCPLQSLHHLKNPAQGPSPERCSIVSGLGARFSSLCDTILLFILSGRSLSLPLSPLLLLPAGV